MNKSRNASIGNQRTEKEPGADREGFLEEIKMNQALKMVIFACGDSRERNCIAYQQELL